MEADAPPPDAPPADAPPEGAPGRAAAGFKRLALVVLAAGGVLLACAAGTALALYLSATAAVPEYEAVVAIDPAAAEARRRELESRLAALASDAQKLPEWKSVVTQDQVNAWLATRLERDFPGFAKAGLLTPRVVFHQGRVMVAAQSGFTRLRGVLTATLLPRITDADELALEIESARIGSLPLPLDALMGQLQESPLAKLGPIRLARVGDSAAAIVDLDRIDTGRARTLGLTGVDVREGELLLRGETRQAAEPVAAPAPR